MYDSQNLLVTSCPVVYKLYVAHLTSDSYNLQDSLTRNLRFFIVRETIDETFFKTSYRADQQICESLFRHAAKFGIWSLEHFFFLWDLVHGSLDAVKSEFWL